MNFNVAINEGLTSPAAIKLVKKAIEELGKSASRDKIKKYIRNNVKNKQHYEANLEGINAAIIAHKKGQL